MLLTAGASSAMLGGDEGAVVGASEVGAVVGVCTSVAVDTLPLVDRMAAGGLRQTSRGVRSEL